MATERRFVPVGRLLAEEEFVRVLKAHLPKPWWRKIVWIAVLLYAIDLAVAFTIGRALHLAWYQDVLLMVLFGATTCSLLRNYYR